jgi:hypothetical protein
MFENKKKYEKIVISPFQTNFKNCMIKASIMHFFKIQNLDYCKTKSLIIQLNSNLSFTNCNLNKL